MDAIKSPAVAALETASPRSETPEVTALVERAKTGDAEAFGDLMRLYERRIVAIGMQMGLTVDDALDACQDAFIKVFKYIGRYRSGESFYRWLYRIAIHAVYDHLRWSRPPGVISMEGEGGVQAMQLREAGLPLDARVEAEDLTRKLLGGLDCLSRQERIVFVLRDLQEMSSEEIGTVLHLSQVTVRRHCTSARQKLRKRLFPTDH